MKSLHTYNMGINFLRAVSIVGIVLYHVFPFAMKGGFLGVCFFFLISGYLLARQSEFRWAEGSYNIRQYYMKKFLRIYPALYLMVMSVIAFFTLFHRELLLGVREETASIFLGYNNWWQMMTQASYFMKMTEHSPFTHLWYLGVQLQLYLIWPLLFAVYKKCLEPRLGGKSVLFFLLLAVASTVAMGVMYQPLEVNRVYYGTDTRSFAFFIGVCLGLCEDTWQHKAPAIFTGVIGKVLFYLSLLVTCVLFFVVNGEASWLYRGGMAVICLFFAFMIYLMNCCHFADSSVCGNKVGQWIGRYSYLIYLWHYPLLFIFHLS